jgi:octaprenyl-diphosphate synthase
MDEVLTQVRVPLAALERRLERELVSEVEFIQLIAHDIVAAGGKRLRPAVVFLSARALGGSVDGEMELALAAELLHTATLLHDDLIDDAETRRGQVAAFRRFGNGVSVLSGDFLLSRVLGLLATLNRQEITQLFADTALKICEGEVLQFQIAQRGEYTVGGYLEVITRKTAVLLRACALGAAYLAGAPPEVRGALERFGLDYGRAFQVQDDLLDVIGDPGVTGKPIGTDVREGKATLPVLYLLEDGVEEAREILERRGARPGDAERMREIALGSRAVARVRDLTEQLTLSACSALRILPPSPARGALEDLAMRASERVA